MADADFNTEGVTLRLSKEEWWFVASAMGYVLHGDRLPDHDFRNILMMDSAEAEFLHGALAEAELSARRSGHHWNPAPKG